MILTFFKGLTFAALQNEELKTTTILQIQVIECKKDQKQLKAIKIYSNTFLNFVVSVQMRAVIMSFS